MLKLCKIAPVIVATAAALAFSGCSESTQRDIKTTVSEWTGGLNRTATLYTNDGKPIKTWKGKFDLQASPNADRCRLFDVNGKRNVVCGGILVVEEN